MNSIIKSPNLKLVVAEKDGVSMTMWVEHNRFGSYKNTQEHEEYIHFLRVLTIQQVLLRYLNFLPTRTDWR